MTGEYEVYASPGTMAESPPTILSVGFPVTPMADEWVDWVGDWVIHDGETYTYPLTGTSTQVNLTMGNLIIESGGTLVFNENVNFVIDNPEAGTYGINIEASGSFIISSPSRSTIIQSSSGAPEKTYPFLSSGTVSF